MIINVSFDQATASLPAGFTTGIAEAVAYFESQFTDPITITIHVGYGEVEGLATTALANSKFNQNSYGYGKVRAAMIADAKGKSDASAIATLPTTDPFGPGDTIVMPQAEAKALGLTATFQNVDGYIGFESGANLWDYNRDDGIGAGLDDFVGAAEHEISEVLGRDSDLGKTLGSVPNVYTPFDLFRYMAAGARQTTTGNPSYFSIDGGVTNLDPFNNFVAGDPGGDLGDWASGAGDDAFLADTVPGAPLNVSRPDLTVMDVLGFDAVVPTILIDPVEGNDQITAGEAAAGVPITGRTTNVEDGRVVTIKVVNSSNAVVDTLTATVAAGKWSAKLTPAQSNALLSGSYTVKADVSDFAGTAAAEAIRTIGQTHVDLYFVGTFSDQWTDTITDPDSGTIVRTNWTANEIPPASSTVEIGAASPYGTVFITAATYQNWNQSVEVSGLVVDAGRTLEQDAGPVQIDALLSVSGQMYVNSGPLIVGGVIATNGQIAVESGQQLELAGDVELDGTGTLYLSNGQIVGADPVLTSTLVNYSTIEGSGYIAPGSNLVLTENHGVIDGDDDVLALNLQAPGMAVGAALTNDGTLEASGGGSLAISSTLIIQTGAGVISANGANSHVDLNGDQIWGGIFTTTGGGIVQTVGATTIDSTQASGVATNEGVLKAARGGNLTLNGSAFHNVKGKIEIDSSAGSSTLTLDSAGVTFDGGGSIFLTDSPYNSIVGGTLTNVDNLIAGSGTISTNIVNEVGGTLATYLNAFDPAFDSAANAMTFNGASIVNAGWIFDSSIAHMVFSNMTIDQHIGTTFGRIYSNSGAVDLASVVVEGGSLNSAASGVIETVDGGSTLDSTTAAGAVTNYGVLLTAQGRSLTLKGTIHNSGTIEVQSTLGSTALEIDPTSGVTLDSAGKVTLDDSPYNSIQAKSGTATLTNVNNTISGAGTFANLTIINQAKGVIDATGAANQLVINSSDILTNRGLVEATGAAGLQLVAQTIDAALGGKIVAGDGSEIDLYSDTLRGGTLSTVGTGSWKLMDAGTLLDGSTASGAVTNAGTLLASQGRSLTLKGTVHNSGTIQLQSTAGSTALEIDPTSGATLDSAGKVTLDDSPYNSIQSSSGTATLTNVNNTISGAGTFANLTIINQLNGVMDATGVSNQLVINSSDILTNRGLVEATGAAGLQLVAQTIDAALGGKIVAGDGSEIDLYSDTLRGGTLSTVGTGSWKLMDAGTLLDGSTASGAVTNASTLLAGTGRSLTLKGTIHNSGTIQVQSTAGSTALEIDPTSGATLDSAGKVTLDDSPYNSIQATTGTATLTNVNNTISGAGAVANLTIVNQLNGVINATGVSNQLVINSSDTLTNRGLVEATGAAGLQLAGQTIDGALGGKIVAANGSEIDLYSDTLRGGTLSTVGTGVWKLMDAGTLLDGSTASGAVSNAGTLLAGSGRSLTLKGTIHNSGIIQLQSSLGSTALEIDPTSGVMLDSGGKVTLDDSYYNSIQSTAGTATLTNVDNAISGAGAFSNLTIVNQSKGVINATGVTNQLVIGSSDVVKNHGLLEATGAAGLSLSSGTVDNSGGTILAAAGSHTALASDLIELGTIQTTGSGYVDIVDSGTILSAGNTVLGLALSATIRVEDSQMLAITGSVLDTGAIHVGVTGGATLELGASLYGAGSIVLFDSASTSVVGGFNNVANTISGAGVISAAIQQQAGGNIEATDADNALVLKTGLAIANAGVLEANGGLLMVDDAVTGAGRALITGGGEIAFGSTFNQNVAFQGAGELALAKSYAGAISGVAVGDKIDLTGLAYAAGATASLSGTTVTVTSGGVHQTLTVSGASPSGYIVTSDGSGGTLLTGAAAATVAQFLANRASLDALPTGFVVVDTAANVSGAFDTLNGDTHVAQINLTDAGAPKLALTPPQALNDKAALKEITNPNYQIAVAGAAPVVIADLATLEANPRVVSLAITSSAGNLTSAPTVGAFSESGSGTSLTIVANLSYGGSFSEGAGAILAVASGDTLTLDGATSFSGAVNGAGAFVFGGGSAGFNAGATVAVANWSITGAAKATISENLTYSGAFVVSSGASVAIAAGDTLTLKGKSTLGGNITGAGTLALAGGAATLAGGATFTVANWSIAGAATSATLNQNLSYAGSLGLASGSMLNISSGDTLTLTGTTNLGGTIAGAGTLTTSGGAATFNPGALAKVANWSMTVAGTTTIAENLSYVGTFVAGAAPTLTISAGHTFTLTGGSTLQGSIGGAGTLVLAGGAATLSANAAIATASWSLSGAATTVTLNKSLTYAGAFSETTGATLSVATGDTLTLKGTSTLNATIGGAGALALTGGAATLAGGATISAAKWSVTGASTTASVNKVLAYSGALAEGAGAAINIASGDSLTLTGTSSLSGSIGGAGTLALGAGTAAFYSGAAVTAANWSLTGAGTTTIATSLSYAGAFNLGAVPKLSVLAGDTLTLVGASTLQSVINGGGALALAGGATTISANAAINVATWSIAGASTKVSLSKSLTFAGSFSETAGATVSLVGGAGMPLTLKGGATFSSATVNGARALYTNGATQVSGLTIGGTVAWNNNATVTESGGALTLGDATGATASLNNTSTAVYDFVDDHGIGLGASKASSIVNAGLIEKTAGGGGSAIAAAIANSGTISATSGTLDLQGAATGTGKLQVGAGANLEVDAAVAAGQTLAFSGSGGEISLDDLSASGVQLFHGSITGFGAGDMIDIGAPFDAATTALFTENAAATGGTLALTDGALKASILFAGHYDTGNFAPGTDAHGGRMYTFSA